MHRLIPRSRGVWLTSGALALLVVLALVQVGKSA